MKVVRKPKYIPVSRAQIGMYPVPYKKLLCGS
jgi:hypothetical protein